MICQEIQTQLQIFKESRNLEFFDETSGYPIDFKLIEIAKQAGPYMPFSVWADPDQASLVSQFRAVYENQPEAWDRGAAGARPAGTAGKLGAVLIVALSS